MFSFPVRRCERDLYSPRRGRRARGGVMATRIRLFAAFGALVTAVILVMQSGPLTRAGRRIRLQLRSTAAPLPMATTTIKWPVVETRRPRPVRPMPRHPARRDPAHRPRVHPAGAGGQPALPLRRRELPDGGRGVRLAHLRGEPAPRRRRAGHRRSPRGAVLGDEADRLEQPLVDHLRDRVQDRATA